MHSTNQKWGNREYGNSHKMKMRESWKGLREITCSSMTSGPESGSATSSTESSSLVSRTLSVQNSLSGDMSKKKTSSDSELDVMRLAAVNVSISPIVLRTTANSSNVSLAIAINPSSMLEVFVDMDMYIGYIYSMSIIL
jgi:hypothetical protein